MVAISFVEIGLLNEKCVYEYIGVWYDCAYDVGTFKFASAIVRGRPAGGIVAKILEL